MMLKYRYSYRGNKYRDSPVYRCSPTLSTSIQMFSIMNQISEHYQVHPTQTDLAKRDLI